MLSVAISAGLGAAVLVVAFDVTFAAHLPVVETGEVSLATRYLASIYGAVNEELMLRFGLLTLVVWAASKIMRATNEVPTRVLWAATVIAAVAFGASHLPAMATLVELTPLVVLRTVGLNALMGTVFGWLYWSRGLGAAIIAHLAADLVIQTAAWWIA